MMNQRRAAYQQYLRSNWWQKRRLQRIALAEGQCEYRAPLYDHRGDYIRGERCKVTRGLEVHHHHYDSLGAETDRDIQVLCRKHHLVMTLLEVQCRFCQTDNIIYHEIDALEVVEGAASDDLDEILTYFTWTCRESGDVVCDACDHMLSKDD